MKDNYKGMTVNERLYASGLLDKFDKAISNKDIVSIKQILQSVDLSDDSIIDILESLNINE